MNLQEQITQILFKFIEQGNIEKLQKEQALLGLSQPDDISLLVDEQNYNQNALFSSVQIKDDKQAIEMTKYLIEVGKCDPCKLDTLNQTCLFYVSRDGINELAKIFLKHGCNPNQVDSYGQTPLFYAAREGFIDVVKTLVEAGAEADHIDNDGQSPMFYAVRNGKMDIIEYLINNG
jgi:ankyrin repeat protein